jgi:hypothetical protein
LTDKTQTDHVLAIASEQGAVFLRGQLDIRDFRQADHMAVF